MTRKLTKLFAGALFAASLFLLPLSSAFAQASCPISSTVAKVITTSPYTVLLTDQCKLLVFNDASAVAVTLPQKSTTFPNGFTFAVANIGAGTVTITPTTSTINGGSTVAVAQSFGLDVFTDGTNYYTQGGGAPGGSGSFNTVTFGASSTVGGTLAGGTTAATIASTGAAGNLIIGTADQSGGVYLGGGATTVGNAAIQAAPGTGSIVNQLVVTPGATGTAPTVLAGGSLADAAVGATFGTAGTGTVSIKTSSTELQFAVLRTASAVNNLNVTGSTGTAVVPITATGSGATIPIGVFPKGASLVALAGTTVANSSLQANTVASAVDFLSVSGTTTGNHNVLLVAAGTDSNISLSLEAAGTGTVNLGNNLHQLRERPRFGVRQSAAECFRR